MLPTIVIVGTAGAHGGGVARGVAANKSFDTVKLATRIPGADSMISLLKALPGTEAVKQDLSDKQTIADAAFATCNY